MRSVQKGSQGSRRFQKNAISARAFWVVARASGNGHPAAKRKRVAHDPKATSDRGPSPSGQRRRVGRNLGCDPPPPRLARTPAVHATSLGLQRTSRFPQGPAAGTPQCLHCDGIPGRKARCRFSRRTATPDFIGGWRGPPAGTQVPARDGIAKSRPASAPNHRTKADLRMRTPTQDGRSRRRCKATPTAPGVPTPSLADEQGTVPAPWAEPGRAYALHAGERASPPCVVGTGERTETDRHLRMPRLRGTFDRRCITMHCLGGLRPPVQGCSARGRFRVPAARFLSDLAQGFEG